MKFSTPPRSSERTSFSSAVNLYMVGHVLGWVSDADGIATLSGLPPGQNTLEAEAWGKEPVVRELNLAAGSVTELGDVVLEDACGEVLIELTGCKDGANYAIIVAQPGTGSSSPFDPVVGNRHKVTGLPLRKYLICLTFAKGGTVVVAEVDLSDNQTSQTVTLDASQVRP